jgi:hypothetical protein
MSVGACSSDIALFRADSSWWSSGKAASTEPLSRTAPADALIGPGGTCAAQAAAPQGAGVGVGMTECEVLASLGPTPSIDIGNESGERSVVMTYSAGEHAGIYRFKSGLLASVEALPEKPKPQRPQRRQHTAQPKAKPKPPRAAAPQAAAPPQRSVSSQPQASPWPQPSAQPQAAPWPQPAQQPQAAPWPQPAAPAPPAPWPQPAQ